MAIELDSTEKTPQVKMCVDSGKFSFKGICMPEDANAFFEPFFNYFRQYFDSPLDKSVIDIDLEYFNTSSTRMLYQMMQMLSQHNNKSNIVINWHYEEDDIDLEEAGEEFKMLAAGIEFNLVKKDTTVA